MPDVPEDAVVSMYEGATPLLSAPGLATQKGGSLWIKQCGQAHTGSFKDLGMTVLVSVVNEMMRRGGAVRAVACASTGDTSAALAAYCARAGIPAVVLLPAGKISTAQLIQPVANGALVLALDTDFDGCMELVQALTEEPSIYLANSLNSLRIEGQKTVGIEIVQQLGWTVPDWIVIPGGNLGNVSALHKGLQLALDLGVIDRLPRICVAQVAAADPLYQAFQAGWPADGVVAMTAGETQASAIRIGAPVSYDKAVSALKATDGVVRVVGEEELADTAALADRTGLFVCPHTAVALAAWRQLVVAGDVGPADRSVVVATASGLKFPEFKVRYHEGEAAHANRPVECDASLGAVREALDRRLATTS
jgi:threonine synthase